MDSMVETLAEYAAGLRFRDLPPDVVHECKRKLIDTLGCAVGNFDSQ
jgi:2-methylcitrate dehydratase